MATGGGLARAQEMRMRPHMRTLLSGPWAADLEYHGRFLSCSDVDLDVRKMQLILLK